MTQRIHPSSLKAPYDIREVRKMIDSWRGVMRSEVPEEVKLIAWLEEMMTEMARLNWQKELERQALANDYDSIVQISESALLGFQKRIENRAKRTVAQVSHAGTE